MLHGFCHGFAKRGGLEYDRITAERQDFGQKFARMRGGHGQDCRSIFLRFQLLFWMPWVFTQVRFRTLAKANFDVRGFFSRKNPNRLSKMFGQVDAGIGLEVFVQCRRMLESIEFPMPETLARIFDFCRRCDDIDAALIDGQTVGFDSPRRGWLADRLVFNLHHAMFQNGAVNRLEHPLLLFIALPWRTKHMQCFSITGVVVEHSVGNRFLNLVPERLDPSPILCADQRVKQFAANGEGNQFGGRDSNLVHACIVLTKLVNLASLDGIGLDIEPSSLQRFDVSTNRSFVQRRKTEVGNQIGPEFFERSTEMRIL